MSITVAELRQSVPIPLVGRRRCVELAGWAIERQIGIQDAKARARRKGRNWRRKNLSGVRSYARDWHARNPTKKSTYNERWKARDPEGYRAMRKRANERYAAKQRAKAAASAVGSTAAGEDGSGAQGVGRALESSQAYAIVVASKGKAAGPWTIT